MIYHIMARRKDTPGAEVMAKINARYVHTISVAGA